MSGNNKQHAGGGNSNGKQKITYWDAYDGTAIRVIEGGEEEMNTLDVEPSGEAFVSGGDDGLVKVRSTISVSSYPLCLFRQPPMTA